MSKPRFSIEAIIDTEAHADTVLVNLRTKLTGKDIFEEHSFSKKVVNGEVSIVSDVRFNNSIDRDDVKDWIREQSQNHPVVKNWVTKAILKWHTCTHNDPIIDDCSKSDYFEWVK